jgi:integrase
MLTDKEISNAKPKAKTYRLSDGSGLVLEVKPAGKYWRLRYRYNGKEKTLALGVYPTVKGPEARAKAADAKAKLAQGVDPSAAKKAIRMAALVRMENTFKAVALEWHEKRATSLSTGHAAQIKRTLENEIFPIIGNKPIAEIEATEVLVALRLIEKRGALEIASKARQWTGMVFRYGIATGRTKHNPVGDLRGVIQSRQTQHYAALDRDGMAEFLRALDTYDGTQQTQLALGFLALTFVRTGELRGATWAEMDLKNQLWRIPATRMKMRADHIVPLSEQSVAILEDLRVMNGEGDLVFPGANVKSKPISENTLLYALYRMGYHGRATGHGFRATASTLLNEMGWRSDVIERQLAHTERNKVRAAYNRAEYLPERKKMMQAWADFLDALKNGSNVIPLNVHGQVP